MAAVFSLPVAFTIATNKFKGKQVLVILLNTLLAMPTVVIGLIVYSLLCRRGVFGNLTFLYTPYAMIIGQFILATPIITALTISALEGADKRILKTARALGANRLQSFMALASEVRTPIFAAIIAGFGRVFSEIGISMMLGGSIKNYTRNLTTAIAFETSRGNFSLALALGIILLMFAFAINITFQLLARRKHAAVRT